MKRTTVLIYKDINAPKEGLREATQKEWSTILQANKGAPMCQRRCFIEDTIMECDMIDRMFIEVPYEEYCRWHKESARSIRNQKAIEKQGTAVSIDAPIKGSKEIALKDTLPLDYDLEKETVNNLMLSKLRGSLKNWKPWACDMLDYYLSGDTRLCTSVLMRKYSVSYRTVATWKKKFEEYLKNIL